MQSENLSKLDKYEKLLQGMLKEIQEEKAYINQNKYQNFNTDEVPENYDEYLDDKNIILIKDNDGNIQHNINSDLGENFQIININKNLSEITKKDYKVIKEQEYLSNCENKKKYIKKMLPAYTFGSTMLSLGKYLAAFI